MENDKLKKLEIEIKNLTKEKSDFENELEFTKSDLEFTKKSIASTIIEEGQYLIQEIEEKRIRNEEEKQRLIQVILKRSKKHEYEKHELDNMSYDDVKSIYIKISKRKSWFDKLIECFIESNEEYRDNDRG